MSPGPNSCPVLCSCAPAEHALAHEGEGEGEGGECSVEFRDWPALLWAVHHAVLAAWRPVLSNALLLQLEQLEDVFAPAVATTAASTAAIDNNPAAVVPDVDVELNSLVNSIILE